MTHRKTMVLGTVYDPCSWLVDFHNVSGPVWEGLVINGGYRILFDHKLGEGRLFGNQVGSLIWKGVSVTDYDPPDCGDYNETLYRCEQNLAKRTPIGRFIKQLWFTCAPVVRHARALRYAFVAAGTAFARAYRDPDKISDPHHYTVPINRDVPF